MVELNNGLGCHSIDGQVYPAPTLKGLLRSIRQLEGGATATADHEYLWESTKEPCEKIVESYFPDSMPKALFNDGESQAMVAYIRSLGWRSATIWG